MSLLSLVGVEDGSFVAFKSDQSTLLCAVLMVGDHVESIRLGSVKVDGRDTTDVLLVMLENIQCDAVILGGISFAGFNVVDPHWLNYELDVPVVIYSGIKPDSTSVLAALKKYFSDWEDRWAPIARLGDVYCVTTKIGYPPVFFEVVGESKEWAEAVLRSSASLTRIPEPVRVAGIVARGLSRSG